ncbi:type II toxin-antitoxin system RelE/ParE family toxin [Bradyrhizobium sp. SRS-191]|uniref:type II toxin-antitoxin system RelE family toxin n=1 Tax=Bradyrhizobium sp. SRS-191 TaxID=2962606 RepID=UPI00211ED039|nr:type II toxin-antitoxin system RelE/ParE family toxin [Bradyrhizobium sp. SRS-191]
MKAVIYSRKALRALRQHANRAALIREKIEQYAHDPTTQANNVKQLTGVDALRLRVGDFRVVFTETTDTINVLNVGPRGDVYS